MLLKFKTRYASPLGNISPGAEAEIDEGEAAALIAGGFATEVNPAEADAEADAEEDAEADAEEDGEEDGDEDTDSVEEVADATSPAEEADAAESEGAEG